MGVNWLWLEKKNIDNIQCSENSFFFVFLASLLHGFSAGGLSFCRKYCCWDWFQSPPFSVAALGFSHEAHARFYTVQSTHALAPRHLYSDGFPGSLYLRFAKFSHLGPNFLFSAGSCPSFIHYPNEAMGCFEISLIISLIRPSFAGGNSFDLQNRSTMMHLFMPAFHESPLKLLPKSNRAQPLGWVSSSQKPLLTHREIAIWAVGPKSVNRRCRGAIAQWALQARNSIFSPQDTGDLVLCVLLQTQNYNKNEIDSHLTQCMNSWLILKAVFCGQLWPEPLLPSKYDTDGDPQALLS